jgi:3-hydroxyisobutyrate dehydrogenase
MGSSMALNTLKGGHALVVHDINRDAAAPHLEAGATWADTPRAVAEASEVVFTSLPGPPEVEAVALSESGLLHGIRPGKVYFDLSTNSPTLVRRIHDVFAKVGAHVLDAPVSGGPHGARTGRLAIWVGGDKAIYDQYKHVLDAIGDKPYYVGPIGTGAVAKLVHTARAIFSKPPWPRPLRWGSRPVWIRSCSGRPCVTAPWAGARPLMA